MSQYYHVTYYINFLLASSSIILRSLFKYLSPPYKLMAKAKQIAHAMNKPEFC